MNKASLEKTNPNISLSDWMGWDEKTRKMKVEFAGKVKS